MWTNERLARDPRNSEKSDARSARFESITTLEHFEEICKLATLYLCIRPGDIADFSSIVVAEY